MASPSFSDFYNRNYAKRAEKLPSFADFYDEQQPQPSRPSTSPQITPLNSGEEAEFKKWVRTNKIPFDPSPSADYDMRGFWRAMRSGDPRARQDDQTKHFPDTWKTKYHPTFSNESIYATADAPRWVGNKLIANDGRVIADESPQSDTDLANESLRRQSPGLSVSAPAFPPIPASLRPPLSSLPPLAKQAGPDYQIQAEEQILDKSPKGLIDTRLSRPVTDVQEGPRPLPQRVSEFGQHTSEQLGRVATGAGKFIARGEQGPLPENKLTPEESASFQQPLVKPSTLLPDKPSDWTQAIPLAAARGALQGAEALTSPEMLGVVGATAGLGTVAATAPGVMGAGLRAGMSVLNTYFTAEMAKGTVEGAKAAKDAIDRGDYEAAAQALGYTGVNGFMAAKGIQHLGQNVKGAVEGFQRGYERGKARRRERESFQEVEDSLREENLRNAQAKMAMENEGDMNPASRLAPPMGPISEPVEPIKPSSPSPSPSLPSLSDRASSVNMVPETLPDVGQTGDQPPQAPQPQAPRMPAIPQSFQGGGLPQGQVQQQSTPEIQEIQDVRNGLKPVAIIPQDVPFDPKVKLPGLQIGIMPGVGTFVYDPKRITGNEIASAARHGRLGEVLGEVPQQPVEPQPVEAAPIEPAPTEPTPGQMPNVPLSFSPEQQQKLGRLQVAETTLKNLLEIDDLMRDDRTFDEAVDRMRDHAPEIARIYLDPSYRDVERIAPKLLERKIKEAKRARDIAQEDLAAGGHPLLVEQPDKQPFARPNPEMFSAPVTEPVPVPEEPIATPAPGPPPPPVPEGAFSEFAEGQGVETQPDSRYANDENPEALLDGSREHLTGLHQQLQQNQQLLDDAVAGRAQMRKGVTVDDLKEVVARSQRDYDDTLSEIRDAFGDGIAEQVDKEARNPPAPSFKDFVEQASPLEPRPGQERSPAEIVEAEKFEKKKREAEEAAARRQNARQQIDAAFSGAKFKKQQIVSKFNDGENVPVDAHVIGHFAVHPQVTPTGKKIRNGNYKVTHIPSGMSAAEFPDIRSAKIAAFRFNHLGDWSSSNPKQTPIAKEDIRMVMRDISKDVYAPVSKLEPAFEKPAPEPEPPPKSPKGKGPKGGGGGGKGKKASLAIESEGEATPAERSADATSEPQSRSSERGSTNLPALSALTLGTPEFIKEDVIPTATSAVHGVKESWDAVLKILAPQTRDPKARVASHSVREYAAEQARRTDVAERALQDARKLFSKRSNDENLDFMTRMESGAAQPTPELQVIADAIRTILDGRRDDVRELGTGKLLNFIQNYYPHIWKDPTKARDILVELAAKRPIEGSKSFLKKRSLPTIKDGIEAGLEPVTYNPVEMVLMKVREVDKYVMAHRTLRELKRQGLVKYVPARRVGQARQLGYAMIDDKIATVYGKPTVTVHEAFDQQMMDRLNKLAKNLGIDHKRETNIGGPRGSWGWAKRGTGEIKTKFGGPESVLIHEIGHQLEWKYNLSDRLRKLKNPVITKELRDLADLRVEGFSNVPKQYQQYIRNKDEKMANAIAALLYAPQKFKRTSPETWDALRDELWAIDKLKPLFDIEPSMVLGSAKAEIPVGGMVIRGYYMASTPVADLMNNYLSPGLRSNALFRGYLGVANVLNQFQLGMSFFHFGMTSIDATVSRLALGVYQAAHGDIAKGVKTAATTPVAAFTNLIQGDKILREWFAPGSQGGDLAAIVDAAVAGGARAKMDDFYHTHMVDRMMEAFRKGNIPGGVWRIPFAAMEKITEPIMSWLVPRQKMGVFADLMRYELERLGPDASREDIRAAAAKVWDSVDNRMGQLVYDNLFWNKVAKDVAMGTTRSVGWNLGTIREIGGGVYDTLKFFGVAGENAAKTIKMRRKTDGNPNDKGVAHTEYEPTPPEFTKRMSYLLALPIVVGIAGAIWQGLMTREAPKDVKDLYFPRTGNLDEHGRPERMVLPSYVKDIYHYKHDPLRTVMNKLHPALSLFGEMITNKDYYGTKIRNEDDPIVRQMLDVTKHVGKSMTPFAVQGLLRERELGADWKKQALPFVGITPAPSSMNKTPAEELIAKFIDEKAPRGSRTSEQNERFRLRGRLIRDLRLGNDILQKFAEGVQKGILSTSDMKIIRERAARSPLENSMDRLSLAESLNVFETANERERVELRPILQKKIVASFDKPYEVRESTVNKLAELGLPGVPRSEAEAKARKKALVPRSQGRTGVSSRSRGARRLPAPRTPLSGRMPEIPSSFRPAASAAR